MRREKSNRMPVTNLEKERKRILSVFHGVLEGVLRQITG